MVSFTQATLPTLSEEEFAWWMTRRGNRIVQHQNRYWMAKPCGFFHGIPYLARLSTAEATRPDRFCWGYRTTLSDADAQSANATMPVHLIENVSGYGLETLSPRRRNQIRNSLKVVEIVALDTPELLLEQGYKVALSAHARTNYGIVPERKSYTQAIEGFLTADAGLILGGLIDGCLGGYMMTCAVGSTAYIESVTLATEYIDTNIGSALLFAWMDICKKSAKIDRVVHGLHAPENLSLCRYKETMGFSVVHFPAYCWFLPPTGQIVNCLRPHVYYRLTGNQTKQG